MKKLITSLLFGLAIFGSSAANIKLESTEANCRKVDGIGSEVQMEIASKFQTSLRTVRFLGAKWEFGPYGLKECMFLFDTGVGPKKCQVGQLLSDDGGKSAFADVNPLACR